ncbi:hypothetical protein O7600_04550 [Micromonospora sp. WMMA1998]|uniref:hypothetical protein n=1 Tax=Micromonospora sp. WMMA1998 TaxID=3015167 RepID=UPI00248D39B9|nr:hypothetical protein [Micromonospora sp. WMMA1998]WBC16115.1 hypothetical protein O7600_04550 [Micromonospora sp. WMMA1998]
MTTVVNRAVRWHRPLLLFVSAMAVLTVVAAVGLVVDPRVLTGAPAWLKPLKFAISFVVYSLTLAWMLSLLPRRSRLAERAATVIVAMSVLEMVVIVGQVLRGTTSHFNGTTPLNTALFDVMGAAIMVLFLAQVVLAVVLLRRPTPHRAGGYAVRLGLGVSLLGMLVAFPMVAQRPTGAPAGITGAHSVGVPDGGPGLPLVGWSTTGGDLRVGHFVGLHALQALPLLAIVLDRFLGARLDEATRARLVLVGGVAYAGVTLLLTGQALRGQPLLRPDALTLTAAAVLALATATAAGAVLGRRSRRAGVVLVG